MTAQRRVLSAALVAGVFLSAMAAVHAAGQEPFVTCTVSGRVLKPDGSPAAGAMVYRVRFCPHDPKLRGVRGGARANADGSFSIAGVACDLGRGVLDNLAVVLPGFGVEIWYAWAKPQQWCKALIKLQEEIAVSGNVMDSRGNPLAGAVVSARDCEYRAAPGAPYIRWRNRALPELSTKTDAQGRFALGYLPKVYRGELKLRVLHERFAVAAQTVWLHDPHRPLMIFLDDAGAIEGKVAVEGVQTPRAGIVISARGEGDTSMEAVTSQEGRFRLGSLPTGAYRLNARLAPGAKWVQSDQIQLHVSAGKATVAPDLVLVEGCVISGKVVDSQTDEPLSPVWVFARGTKRFFSNWTGPDGTFRIRCLPDRYEVFSSNGRDEYLPMGMKDGHEVVVKAGQTVTGVIFKRKLGLTMDGVVVDPAGQPVAGAKGRWRAEGNSAQISTDAQGRFRVVGLPPNQRIKLSMDSADGRLGQSFEFKTGPKSSTPMTLRLIEKTSVKGVVTDPDGWPIQGVKVMGTLTDVGGSYKLRLLPNRVYAVRAHMEGYRYAPGTGAAPVRPEPGQAVVVENIVLVPKEMARIAGQVIDAQGRPAANARVRLSTFFAREQSTLSDDRGAFVFKNVEQRSWPGGLGAVLAQDEARGLAGQAILKQPTDQVTVRLCETSTITGRVVDKAGLPVSGVRVQADMLVGSSSFPKRETIRTGEDGTYRIPGLAPDCRVRVRFKKDGRGSRSIDADRAPRGEHVAVADVVMRKADSFIAGKVTDVAGAALADMRVDCWVRRVEGYYTKTNAEGAYHIKVVPDVQGYHVSISGSLSFRGSRREDVPAGSAHVDFVLQRRPPPRKMVPGRDTERWVKESTK